LARGPLDVEALGFSGIVNCGNLKHLPSSSASFIIVENTLLSSSIHKTVMRIGRGLASRIAQI
jgi:hypothetical protein